MGEAALAQDEESRRPLSRQAVDELQLGLGFLMTYRGIEYVKVRGHWRAKPGQGTGERSTARGKKRARPKNEPTEFWECVNEKTGGMCGTKHRKAAACWTHQRSLNRVAGRAGGRSARKWEAFKVVGGRGYHDGVGAPKAGAR